MPSPSRVKGSTSAAAVLAAVVAAEKPIPCRARQRMNRAPSFCTRGPMVPISKKMAPMNRVKRRPRSSTRGPQQMRMTPAAAEKIMAPMPARATVPPVRSR